MDKINDCYERICVILGVNNGVLTERLLEEVFGVHGLNRDEREAVLEVLTANGIIPVPEETCAPLPPETDDEDSSADEEGEQKDAESDIQRTQSCLNLLMRCTADMLRHPNLTQQYRQEIMMFPQVVSALVPGDRWTPARRIKEVLLIARRQSVPADRRFEWVCGTYISSASHSLEPLIRLLFSDDEQQMLLEACATNSALSYEQVARLTVLLHHTPRMRVHRSLTIDGELPK